MPHFKQHNNHHTHGAPYRDQFTGHPQQPGPPRQHGGYPQQPSVVYYQQPMPQTEIEMESGHKPSSVLLFNDKIIRAAFIRKVFGLVTLMLLFVFGLVALFTFQNDCRTFAHENQYLATLSYIVFFATIITISCCDHVRRNYPGNLICLCILTFSLGFMTAMIAATFEKFIVVVAIGVTVICCGSIVLFSCQTKYDFTNWIGVMFVVSICLFFFDLFAIVLMMASPDFHFIYLVYAVIAVLVMMVYLAIDTQLIIGGKHVELLPDEYILGAVLLFVDVVLIFFYLLQIISGISSK